MPTFAPKIYPDVVKDLAWWTGILLTGLVYVVPSVLPPDVASGVRSFAETLPAKGLLEPVFLVGVIAVILVGFLKVHELYDLYVIRWRAHFDLDVIVPKLTEPLIERLDPSFLVVARSKRREVMNLYYHFVRDGKPIVSENLVMRFYVRVLRYWVTYLNEMVLLVFAAISLLSAAATWGEGAEIYRPLVGLGVALVLLLVNRWLMGVWRDSVERATEEEIENIHEEHLNELSTRLEMLHERLKLTYRPGA